jgi:hypothetical protein
MPDTSMPAGWGCDPNWGSDVSIWDEMRGPGDPPKYSRKKWKKRGIEHPSYGTLAELEKVTRDYLMRSSTHNVDNEVLTAELQSVC